MTKAKRGAGSEERYDGTFSHELRYRIRGRSKRLAAQRGKLWALAIRKKPIIEGHCRKRRAAQSVPDSLSYSAPCLLSSPRLLFSSTSAIRTHQITNSICYMAPSTISELLKHRYRLSFAKLPQALHLPNSLTRYLPYHRVRPFSALR